MGGGLGGVLRTSWQPLVRNGVAYGAAVAVSRDLAPTGCLGCVNLVCPFQTVLLFDAFHFVNHKM